MNIKDLFAEIDNKLKDHKGTLYLSTGQLSDSLVFDHFTNFTSHVYEYLKDRPEVAFEFRSKCGYSGFIDKIDPLDNLMFCYTLSPDYVVKKYELCTDTLERRIKAMEQLQKKGFRTGVIMDPLIHYEGWEQDYKKLINMLFERLNFDRIDYIYVGAFRYIKGMDKEILGKFPNTDIFYDEFVECRDGKFRYFKPIRYKMYGLVRDEFVKKGKTIKLCMEFSEVIRRIVK